MNYCSCKFEVSSPCSHGDMSRNVPGSSVIKMCSKLNETLLRTLHAEVRILAVHEKYVAHPLSQRIRWRPKRWKESSGWRFDGKERKDKRVYRSLVHKIEERSVWRVLSLQLPCLPTCNYGNGSVSWTIKVSYTVDFFEP